MLFEKTMLKRIPQYEADGILDSANATRLTEHLKKSVQTEKSYFISAIYFAGVMLILASACLFVINIWDALGTCEHLAMAFVPLLLSGILGICVLAKDWGYFMRESAGVANMVSFIVLLSVISSTLGLEINTINSLMSFIGFAILVMIVFKSKVVACMAVVMLAKLSSEYSGCLPHKFFDIIFVGATFIAICTFTAWNWKRSDVLQRILGLIVCIFTLIITNNFVKMMMYLGGSELSYMHIYGSGDVASISVFGVSALMLLSASFGKFSNLEYWRLPHLFLALIVLSFVFYLLNDSTALNKKYLLDYFIKVWNYSKLSGLATIIFSSVILIAWVVMFWKSLFTKDKYTGMSILSLMYPLTILASFSKGQWYMSLMLVSNAIYFLSAFFFAFLGLKKKDYVLTNIGVIMFISQGIVRVFNSEIGTLVRAIFFGICGIILIVANYMLNKKIGGKNEK